jgi:ATP-binding cassette, subfamily B, multidrug efflux pump
MASILKLLPFIRPYKQRAIAALVLLTTLVFMDLSLPRLIQHLIDQGITQKNLAVVVQTSAVMLTISAISTLVAIANNNLSVQVGEGVARDLREALFLKIQSFSFGNLDRLQTGQLMVRLTSDTGAVQRTFQVSLRIGTRAPLLMVGSLLLMINTSPSLALTMLPLLLVTSVIIVVFILAMEPLFRSVQQKLDKLNTVLQENIGARHAVHGRHVAGAHPVRQHRHGHRHLGRRAPIHPGPPLAGPDRGLHQLSADHHDPADHDDHAGEYLGQRHGLGQARQPGA